jgi:hypothetical protein
MTRDTFDMFEKPERGRFGDDEHKLHRVNGMPDLLEFTMVFHHETQAGMPDRGALFCSVDGDEARAVWLPKSLIEFRATGDTVTGHRKSGQAVRLVVVNVTLPEWLAVKNGLL